MTYYQRNRDVILIYGKIWKIWKYVNMEYGKNRYHYISEEKKQKLKEYQKKYREAKKSKYNNE